MNEGDKFFEERFKEINEAYEYLIKNHTNHSFTDENTKSSKSNNTYQQGALPKITKFKVDNSEIFYKEPIGITWATENADSVNIDVIGDVDTSGSQSVNIKNVGNIIYVIIKAKNTYGIASEQLKVLVKKKSNFRNVKKAGFLIVLVLITLMILPAIFVNNTEEVMEVELERFYEELKSDGHISQGLVYSDFSSKMKDPILREKFFVAMKDKGVIDPSLDLETFSIKTGLKKRPTGIWQYLKEVVNYYSEQIGISEKPNYENLILLEPTTTVEKPSKPTTSISSNFIFPNTDIKTTLKSVYKEAFKMIKYNSDTSAIVKVDVSLLNHYFPSPYEEAKDFETFSIDYLSSREIIFQGSKYLFLFFKSVPAETDHDKKWNLAKLDQNKNWKLKECNACPGWMTIVRLKESVDGFILDELIYDCDCGSNSRWGKVNLPTIHNIDNSFLVLDSRSFFYHMGTSAESIQVCNALDLKRSLYLSQGGESDTTYTHKYETIKYDINENIPTLYLENVNGKMDYLYLKEIF